jgi:8-oxo-dGTP pyrophosphatase MutT (NUDIX family)
MTSKIRPHHITDDVSPDYDRALVRQYAVISNEKHEILILQHPPSPKHIALWTLPGGKAVLNEIPIDCIKRECREEIGFAPPLAHGVLPLSVNGELWLFYRGHIDNPHIRLSTEHIAYAWKSIDDLHGHYFRHPLMRRAIRTLTALEPEAGTGG